MKIIIEIVAACALLCMIVGVGYLIKLIGVLCITKKWSNKTFLLGVGLLAVGYAISKIITYVS